MNKVSIRNSIISLFMIVVSLFMIGCDTELELEVSSKSPSISINEDFLVNATTATTVTTTTEATTTVKPKETKKAKATTTTKAKKKKPSSSKVIAHFIDVGQGDSIFIELPEGECMLIDAGESQYGSTVLKYIKDKGYTRIDYLIATHPHSDHIGGLTEVIQGLDIGTIYMSNAVHTTRTYENLLIAIKDKGKKMKRAKAGVEIINTKNVKASFIAPVSDNYSDLNDYSAVVRLDHGDKSFLFTGDATTRSESEITANVSVDVLKVGHHGSDTSNGENFIKKVSPSHAIIQVGKSNKYGHPTQSVVSRLQKHGAKVYRTDEVGTIIVTSDGSSIKVNSKATTSVQPPANQPKGTQKANGKSTEKADSKSTEKKTESKGDVVYITKTGKKYHRSDCSSLSKSKIEISLKEARKKYEPCKRCNPPN